MAFNEQSLQARVVSDLTEKAEQRAIAHYTKTGGKVVKYGLNWKGMLEIEEFKFLSSILRKTPDLMVIRGRQTLLVEVKACNDFFKIKLNDLIDYHFWSSIEGIYFLFYVDTGSQAYNFTYKELCWLLNGANKYPLEAYHDGPKYFNIPLSALEPFKI